MPVVQYKLVSGRTLRELHDKVVQLETEGFRPFGLRYKTISLGSGKPGGNQFHQAMLRTEKEPASAHEFELISLKPGAAS